MVDVRRVFPHSGVADSGRLLDDLAEAQLGTGPFDPAVIEFMADLARTLRRHPSVQKQPALSASRC